jgi:hypothetical protein
MLTFPDCLYCKNLIGDNKFICKAFTKGIPKDILFGKIEHNKVLEGQTGDYVF